METQTPLKKLQAGLSQKFNALVGSNRKVRVQEVDELPPDPDAILATQLQEWAKDRPDEFFSWLDEEIARAHDLTRQTLENHAKLSFNMGVEEGLQFIKQKFETWAGQG